MAANISSGYEQQVGYMIPASEDEARALKDVFARMLCNVSALLAVHHSAVALLDEAQEILALQATRCGEEYSLCIPQKRVKVGEGLESRVLEQKRGQIIHDADHLSLALYQAYMPSCSVICVPLLEQDRCIGVFMAYSENPHAFRDEQIPLLTLFSEQFAVSIVQARCATIARARENQYRSQALLAKDRLQAVLDAASDGFVLLDADNCCVEVNEPFERIFQLNPMQALGMPCLDVLDMVGMQGAHTEQLQLREALQQRRVLTYLEMEVQIRNTTRLLEMSLTPIATGDESSSLLVVRDVTELREATRTQASFLSMMTHELRSPLNALNGYLDLVLTGVAGELNEQQREFVRRARVGSEQLFALLEDLLLISRADAGRLRLHRTVIHLPEVITNAVEEMEITAKDSGVELCVAISNDIPPLYADAVRIQQVLRNLLSNAIRFTDAGGRVTIAACVEQEGTLEDEETLVRLEVSDTGQGIAAHYHQSIFDRFFQVPEHVKSRTGGQGLGLAIVKMIVGLHGGSVQIKSTPGEGSTFTCLFPALEGAVQRA